MKISYATDYKKDDLINFIEKAHPGRCNAKEKIDWFSFDNPFLGEKGLSPAVLALTEEGRVVGQFLLSKQQLHYKGLAKGCFIGHDFFVDEAYREKGVGALLLIKSVRGHSPFFGVGLTEDAQKLYKAAKIDTIGLLRKFLWINSYSSSVAHCLRYFLKKRQRHITENIFPKSMPTDSGEFSLIENFSDLSYEPYYDPDLIQFSRSLEFIRWRFFASPIKYYFYTNNKGSHPAYFVLRKTFRKGLKLLSIVDYKAPLNDTEASISILKACKDLAKTFKLDGVVTSSSSSIFDKMLKKEGFFKASKETPIVSTLMSGQEMIDESKKEIFVTMADSDLDLNFGDE